MNKPTGQPTVESEQRLHEVIATYLESLDSGQPPNREDLITQNPDIAADLESFFANEDRLNKLAEPLRSSRQEALSTVGRFGLATQGAQGSFNPAALLSGSRNFGDYELLEELARGGMGVVFKARHITLHRVVALKMILAGHLAYPADIQRFKAEAEAAANLDHPNIVPIYEVSEHDGQQFFTMKLVEGGTLADAFSKRKLPLPGSDPQEVLQLDEGVRLIAKTARAVHYAHQRGILHRDLKPSNILLDNDGQPHVTDFGLAKRVEEEHSGLTKPGAILGTPSYMPPEQADPSLGEVTTGGDIYSLGAILYELLTGRPPFREETPLATVRCVVEEEPAHPRTVKPRADRDLATISLKCLEKQPSRRYGSAEALAEDLERWLGSEPILARPANSWEKLRKWAKRRPAAALLVAVTIFATLAVGAIILWNNRLLEEKNVELAESNEQLVRILYSAQLRESARQAPFDPTEGLRLLNEESRCPPGMRDFAWGYLHRLCNRERMALEGHSGWVSQVAYSPDGRTIASVGWDSLIKLWDAETGKELSSTVAHRGPALAVTFSSDKEMLATSGRDQTVKIWRWENDQLVLAHELPFPGNGDPIRSIAFSPDDKWIAAAGRSIVLWNVATGEQRTVCVGHRLDVLSVDFSPDGKFLAAGGRDEIIRFWDVSTIEETEEPVRELSPQAGAVWAVCFSPDGQRLASGCDDMKAVVWDVHAGYPERSLPHTDPVYCVAFSPDGRLLATGSNFTRIWDVDSRRAPTALHGHRHTVGSVAFAPDGNTLLSGSYDSTARLWEVFPSVASAPEKSPDIVRAHRAAVIGISALPAEDEVISLDDEGVIRTTGIDRNYIPMEVRLPEARSLAVGVRHDVIALGCAAGKVVLLNPRTLEMVTELDAGQHEIRAITFSPGEKMLATGDVSGQIRLWTVKGEPIQLQPIEAESLEKHESSVLSLAFGPDGKLLASGGVDKQLILHDLSSMTTRFAIGHPGPVYSMAFAPDGVRLSTGSGSLKLWNLRDGSELGTFKAHSNLLSAVAFSPDGKTLATASFDKTIKLWDPVTGHVRVTLTGHLDAIRSMKFMGDNRTLLSGGDNGVIRIWRSSGF